MVCLEVMKKHQSWVEIYEERSVDVGSQGFSMRNGRVVHVRRWRNFRVPKTESAEIESLASILMVCVSAREVKEEGMANGVLRNR